MAHGIFVLGCDAGVGASLVARGLLSALRARDIPVAPCKPVEVGCAPLREQTGLRLDGLPGPVDAEGLAALGRLQALAGPPPAQTFAGLPADQLRPPQALALRQASGCELPLDLVNPFRFGAGLDPATAGRLAGRPFQLEAVAAAVEQLLADADQVVIEGTGGPLTPLSDELLQLDLVDRLALPVLLVGASLPGTVSRCLLALEAVAQRQLPLAGLVLTRRVPEPHPEEASYGLLIEAFAGDVLRGVLPFFSAAQLEDPAYLAERFSVHLDLDRLLAG